MVVEDEEQLNKVERRRHFKMNEIFFIHEIFFKVEQMADRLPELQTIIQYTGFPRYGIRIGHGSSFRRDTILRRVKIQKDFAP